MPWTIKTSRSKETSILMYLKGQSLAGKYAILISITCWKWMWKNESYYHASDLNMLDENDKKIVRKPWYVHSIIIKQCKQTAKSMPDKKIQYLASRSTQIVNPSQPSGTDYLNCLCMVMINL